MKTILVPVDFSPASRNALHFAAQLGQKVGAELVLFHAYMLPTPVSEVPYMMVTADELQKENEQLIRQEAKNVTTQYGARCQTLVRLGIASDEVKNYIRENPTDLIIMGMKGAGGIELIMGSTTTNVIRKVNVPVLVVPHDCSFSPLKSIAYAADLDHPVNHNLYQPLLQLAAAYQSDLHIVHVQTNHTAETADKLMSRKEMQQAFTGYKFDFKTIENPSVTHGVNEYLQKYPADLLVMMAHKHGFLEQLFTKNHTAAMAYATHTPLLILQDKG